MFVARLKQIENIKKFVLLGQEVIRQAERKGETTPTLSFLAETFRYIKENAEGL